MNRWLDLGHALLDVVRAFYVAEDVELPTRQLVTPGSPIWEVDACDGLVAVQIERTFFYEGDLASQVIRMYPAVGFSMEGATIGVHVLRCVPSPNDDGTAPTVEAEEAAAALILGDVERVARAVIAAARSGELVGCGQIAMEGWTSAGPDGGWAGGITRFRVGA